MAEQQKLYERFSLSQRLEHWVMTISFIILAVTGLPQRYALAGWAEWSIAAMGGIESVRIIHRIAAVVLLVVSAYHLIAVAYRIYVKRSPLSMLPGLKDATDMLDAIRYNLGMAVQHPKFPRYNVAEKLEYWAIVWGTLLMGLTGFMLWNPIATTRFLPGEFVPAAKAAHSAEALLAVLAIIIWHFYWVHLKMFNKAMFTGKMTREQMEHEHAAELERIESGYGRVPVPREVKRKRERVFLPVAAVLTLVAFVGLYSFITLEETAITTIPTAEQALAFVPATPTPTREPLPTPTPVPATVRDETAPEMAPVIPHRVEGREDCLMCHQLDGPVPYPENHQEFPVSTCLVCHSTEEENPLPAPIQHSIEGREECLLCHGLDLLPASHQDADFSSEECVICHSPAEDLPEAAAEEEEPAAAAEGGQEMALTDVPPITHSIDGRQACLQCHALDAMSPFPENHAQWPESICLSCHATEGEAPLPSPLITHEIEGRENCLQCHPLGNLSETHQEAEFNNDNCALCHAPAVTVSTGEVEVTEPAAEEAEEPLPEQEPAPEEDDEATAGDITFEADIQPLLEQHCERCHSDPAFGGLDVTGYEALAEGGDSGPAFVPGEPEESLIVQTMQERHPYRLVGDNLQLLEDWIAGLEPDAAAEAEEATAEEETAAEEETEATTTEEEEAAALVDAPSITHDVEGRENCLLCHALDAMSPFPENHADWPDSTCLACHAPEGETPSISSPDITHEIEGREACLACHPLANLSDPHQEAEFTAAECLFCHSPEQEAEPEEAEAEEEEAVSEEEAGEDDEATAGDITFEADIQPLLEQHCERCHSDPAFGGLDVTGYEALAEGGDSGPAFVPGEPEESLIVQTMQERHPYRLVGDNLQLLEDWIAAGAEEN